MFISKVAIIGKKESNVSKNVHDILNELGYILTEPHEADVIIAIGSTEMAIRQFSRLKERSRRVLLSISEDGSYVIPLSGEGRGGSMIGGLLSDLLGAELILTSFTSQNTLTTIEEFMWINALKILEGKRSTINSILRNGEKVKVMVESRCLDLRLDDGFQLTDDLEEASIIITREGSKYNAEHNKIILEPREVLLPVWFTSSTPIETVIYSIFTTMKSIFIYEKRVDKLFVPFTVDQGLITEVSKVLRSNVCKLNVVPYELSEPNYMDMCKHIVSTNGGTLILRPIRRAMGVITCLGIK